VLLAPPLPALAAPGSPPLLPPLPLLLLLLPAAPTLGPAVLGASTLARPLVPPTGVLRLPPTPLTPAGAETLVPDAPP
jgi:hypothetical protein